MVDIIDLAARIIKENRFLSLATTNKKGEIWATPLSYSYDEGCNFYVTTAVDSVHINHVRANPYVAFSIFDSTRRVSDIDGIQVYGIMGEVEPNELERIVKAYYLHVFPDPNERKLWEAPAEYFTKDEFPVYRFYQIKPINLYKRDTENIDVDRRVEIDILKLSELLRRF